ncbi:MAG: NADH-quinone oxidoreductase subunit C [Desulfitobacterium hafniense]|nr:NADH-quinone oxidoreductase subunit C [Desulfitobacterium hafniense]
MQNQLRDYLLSQPDSKITIWSNNEGFVWLEVDDLPKVLEYLLTLPERPVWLTHVMNDERELGHGFTLYLLLHLIGDFTLTLAIKGLDDSFPSLTPIFPAFNWAEREAQDLFGLKAKGHPDNRPLILHPGWQIGFHPLRKDIPSESLNDDKYKSVPLPVPNALGEGIFEIPVGPIHAGIIEPGHFRFQTIGETVLNLDAQLFYTHKGIEKLLEGKDLLEGLSIIERLCAVCTVSHSLAYCEAVEKLADIELTRETLLWRTILAELERLYNHIGDIGNMCAGVGFALGNANGLQGKERLQRLNHEVFAHRFLRGVVVPGGLKIIPDSKSLYALKNHLTEIARDFEEWIPLILECYEFRQRAVTTGMLKRESAIDLGVTGVAARASGVNFDWRTAHAHLLYPELAVKPVVEETGDVWARISVRVCEVRESFRIIMTLLREVIITGESAVKVSPERSGQVRNLKLPPLQIAWGCAESPRGTDVIWLMTDEQGKIFRCRIRTAAYANWPAVPLAVLGNIVPDFPLINKSFELCYSCCDR